MSVFTINESTNEYTLERPVSAQEIIDQAKGILVAELKTPGELFITPSAASDFFSLSLAWEEREVFACLFLSNRHQLLHYEELFFGTIDGAEVHPREVVKAALTYNAAAVIFAHNHPSGVAEPSQSDQRITERLKEALALISVRVLDHFVIGSDHPVSFAERGLL